jgi:hypothetical protein
LPPNWAASSTALAPAVLDLVVPHVQHDGDDDQGDQPDGHVDVEDEPPAGDAEERVPVGEEPADQRTEHHGEHEHAAEVALVFAAVPGLDDRADDGECQRHQAAAAESLDGAERDQFAQVLRHAAQYGADQEHTDREHVDLLGPE